MNKLAQLQLAKELLAQEYLQKQAALEEMIKEAVSIQKILSAAENSVLPRIHKALGSGGPAQSMLSEAPTVKDFATYATGLLDSPALKGLPMKLQINQMLANKLYPELSKARRQMSGIVNDDIISILINQALGAK